MNEPFSVSREASERRFRIRSLLAALAAAGLLLLLASEAWAAQFTGGPSIRVTPNVQVEFKWITDAAWFGKVEVFNNPDGTGTPVLTQQSVDALGTPIAATQQVIVVDNVGQLGFPLAANTGYFFRVTATDPTRSNPDLIFPGGIFASTPLPPFFTGAQVITNVGVASITTSGATVAWQANVIGFGKVVYGPSSLSQTVQDAFNITDHALDLTGLSPATTYQFLASNKHAIDGDDLASATGQFTTAGVTTTVVFTQPHADPRVIPVGDVSIVSIRTKNQGNPVPGVVVGFAIDPSSAGSGTLSSAQATTDANGIAIVQLTAIGKGLIQVQATASNATNSPLGIPVVVR